MNLKKASFFKIIMRDSDDFISLSPVFTKKYMEESNETQTIVLKTNSSTAEWKVKYLKIDGKYYFMDGWLKFMKDNGVQMGDFLVFWLVSRSPTVFEVFPYAPNTCLKNQSSCSGNINPGTPKVGHGLGGPSASADADSDACDDDDDDDKETSMEEVPAYDVSVNKNINKSMSKIVMKTYTNCIPLTKEFENATGIGCYDTLLLKNKEGSKWKVDIRRYINNNQKTLRISKGWAKFVKDNKVEVGDKCEFKHLKGKLVRVHVFKKNERSFGNKSNNGD
uniref:B3 domain-containing protein REM5-like n=1 Tax=Erigeron canadensis TaxID=72917 RepID=UPI001CB88B83|nr:B3 domain-containing protein REM5-like [Erigeron canadensis]